MESLKQCNIFEQFNILQWFCKLIYADWIIHHMFALTVINSIQAQETTLFCKLNNKNLNWDEADQRAEGQHVY